MLVAKKKPITWRDRLKALRLRHGDMTQAEAAERIGVALRTWVAWENGPNKPGRLAMMLLRQHFPTDFPKEK